jgi:hypothetical protein
VATYLLKATDEDMERWREWARERGQSFAAFVRSALDEIGNEQGETPRRKHRVTQAARGDASPPGAAAPARASAYGGKTFRGPDPKPNQRP